MFRLIKLAIRQFENDWAEAQDFLMNPPLFKSKPKLDYKNFLENRIDQHIVHLSEKWQKPKYEIRRRVIEYLMSSWIEMSLEFARQEGIEPDLDQAFLDGVEEAIEIADMIQKEGKGAND